MIPCSYWASACIAVLPSHETFYVISVRQTRDLPVVSLFPHPASFRFHLTMNTLAFGYILPTTGRIRDFNPLETCAARRTTKVPVFLPALLFYQKKYYNQSYKCGFFLIPQSVQEQRIHSEFGISKIYTNVDFNSSNNI